MASINPEAYTVCDPDGAAILDVRGGRITTLNPTGAYIWQGLERGETLVQIVAHLAQETGEDIQVVDADVRTFVRSLEDNALLTQDGGSTDGQC